MHPVPEQNWQLSVQQPTCTNLRIRSVEDAHRIFYAVRKGILRMVTRRLDADERNALKTGCVYAWEERSPNSEITGLGIERFTEGRRWSPSRVRDEFLFYYEKFVPPDRGASSREPPGWEQLVKQTYSVWVDTGKGRRKWHLTAYFTQSTVDGLGTVDNIPNVRRLDVPAGMFTSTRVGRRKNTDSDGPAVARVYAPFPSPLPPLAPRPTKSGPSTIVARASSPSVEMYEPYSRPQSQAPSPATYYSSAEPQPYSPLPSTSRLISYNYSAPDSFSVSPQDYTRADHDEYPRSNSGAVEHPPAPSSAQLYRDPPEYTPGVSTNDRGRRRRSAPHRPGPHSQAQQASGGWFTSPMVPYQHRHRQGSPRSDYTSSSSSSYASSPSAPSYPLYPPESPLHANPPGYGRTPSLPRLQIPPDPHPPFFLPDADAEPRQGGVGPRRMVPLTALTRVHPYRRDPTDDSQLRLLPRPSP
ncbi:hypothetical protein DFH07DRAFT_321464 [Mycena maculata]|uniref:cAMP-independent regulatory protein pac2 n=1 Tax=Mycena maculata TaxID=230809 RepID=A0AAD7KDA8_9AGAR|nr:hypothetical protein DFH07DRAFT_321464 [Mycena maculata]